jgi:hypothetical protein
VSLDN